MIRRLLAGLVCVAAMPMTVAAQQVIFSHRQYSATAQTFQQLWVWSPDGTLEQISHVRRHHLNPYCDAADHEVMYWIDDSGREASLWHLNISTGVEGPSHVEVRAGAPVDPLALRLPPGVPQACDPGTIADSPDGRRRACAVKGTAILISDAKRGASVTEIPFTPRMSNGEPYDAWPLQSIWSPDGSRLLVGHYGENGGSSNLEAKDYFLLDLVTRTWTPAFFGTGALWLWPRVILYVTARDTTPLTTHSSKSVWTAHLTTYDPVTQTSRAITSGLSNDLNPIVCAPPIAVR